jgi:hypothetical protein
MRRSLLNILAALGVAITLSGCVVVPWNHHGGGYGYGGGPGSGHYHNGY